MISRMRLNPLRAFYQLLVIIFLMCAAVAALAEDRNNSGPTSPQVSGRMMTRPGEIRILPDREYYDELLYAIRRAEYDIFVSMFIFKVTDSPANRPAAILNELILAGERGVRVRVLLERSDYDEDLTSENMQTATMLKRKNIEVSFDSPQTTTHTKAVVIDERYVFIGSHNLTHAALAHNHELSLLLDNRDLAAEVLNYLKTIK